MQWTDEKQRFVRELWPTHSAGAIVGKVCSQFGGKCNRNMVIGIVHRMQRKKVLKKKGAGILPRVNTRTTRPAKPEPKPKRKPKPAMKEYHTMPRPYAPHPGHIQCPCNVIELEQHNCHWPIGDPRQPGFYFCGAVVVPDRQYCPAHLQAAHHEAAA